MAWRSGVVAGAVTLAAVLGSENSLAAGNCTGRNEIMTLKLAEIQQELMTSASACHNPDEYRHFVDAYKPALDLADRAMQNVFRATSGGDAAYAAFKDELAKGARLRSLTDNAGFCAEAHAEFRAAVSGREAMEALIDAQHPYVDLPILDCSDPRAAAMIAARNVATNELGFSQRGVLTEEVAALPLTRALGVHMPGLAVKSAALAANVRPAQVAAAAPLPVAHGAILPAPALPHVGMPQWQHLQAPQIATAQPTVPQAAQARLQPPASAHPSFAHETVKLAQVTPAPLNRTVGGHVPAVQVAPSFPHETVKLAQVTAAPVGRMVGAHVPAMQISPAFPHQTVRLAQVTPASPGRMVSAHVPAMQMSASFPRTTVRMAKVTASPLAQDLAAHVPHVTATPHFAHETVKLAQVTPVPLAQSVAPDVPHIRSVPHFAHRPVELAQVAPAQMTGDTAPEVPRIAASPMFAHESIRHTHVKPGLLARSLVADVPDMAIRSEQVAANVRKPGETRRLALSHRARTDSAPVAAQLSSKPVAQIPDMTARLAEAAARAAVLLHDEAGMRLSARATLHRAMAAIDMAANIPAQKAPAHAPKTRLALAETAPQTVDGLERGNPGGGDHPAQQPSDESASPAQQTDGTQQTVDAPQSAMAAQLGQAAERAAAILMADADARARTAQLAQRKPAAHRIARPPVSHPSDPPADDPPQAPVEIARADLDHAARTGLSSAGSGLPQARVTAGRAPARPASLVQTASAHAPAAVIRPVAVVGVPLAQANAQQARLQREAANVVPADNAHDAPKATTYDDAVMPDKADGNGGRNPHDASASQTGAPARNDDQQQQNADQGRDSGANDPGWNGDSEQAYAYEYGPARAAAEVRRHRRAAWGNYDRGGPYYGYSDAPSYSQYNSWRNDQSSATDWPDQ